MRRQGRSRLCRSNHRKSRFRIVATLRPERHSAAQRELQGAVFTLDLRETGQEDRKEDRERETAAVFRPPPLRTPPRDSRSAPRLPSWEASPLRSSRPPEIDCETVSSLPHASARCQGDMKTWTSLPELPPICAGPPGTWRGGFRATPQEPE